MEITVYKRHSTFGDRIGVGDSPAARKKKCLRIITASDALLIGSGHLWSEATKRKCTDPTRNKQDETATRAIVAIEPPYLWELTGEFAS